MTDTTNNTTKPCADWGALTEQLRQENPAPYREPSPVKEKVEAPIRKSFNSDRRNRSDNRDNRNNRRPKYQSNQEQRQPKRGPPSAVGWRAALGKLE